MMRQPVIAYGAVIALDTGVLLRLARLDERDLETVLGSPSLGCLADVFQTVVAPDHARFAASFDQLVRRPDDTFRGQREIDIDDQAFAVEVVNDVE